MMLSGKVAVVTGGGAGIGAAIVERFAREGAAVVILDINLEEPGCLATILSTGNVVGIPCDVTAETQVIGAIDAVIERHGSVDILVNSAGIAPKIAPLDELSESDWDAMIDVHAKGCFLCCRHTIPHMKERRRGAIVNIASLGGVRGRPDRHSYIAAKHAVVGLTKSIALEGIAHNIRANAIAPGPVGTPGSEEDLAEHRAAGGSEISFVTTPGAIAWAALFLVADESVNITGTVLPVDGGVLAGSLARGPLRFPAR